MNVVKWTALCASSLTQSAMFSLLLQLLRLSPKIDGVVELLRLTQKEE